MCLTESRWVHNIDEGWRECARSSPCFGEVGDARTSVWVARNWYTPFRTSLATAGDGNESEDAQSSSTVWHPSRHVVGNAIDSSPRDSC